jgi:1-acyl-sn-glycerol-3-phosphate acyltransferase
MLHHYLGLLPRALWKTFFVLNFAVSLILLYPVFIILLMREDWYPKTFALMRFWARWVLHVPGIRLQIEREEHPPSGACVIVANHTSYLDIVVSYILFADYFAYMGKLEIDKAPLLRTFFRDRHRHAGMNLYVDRTTRSGSYKAFQQAGEKLGKGIRIFIYPEGAIESRGQLRPFKNGAFRLAIDHQVPIIPVTFLNNWKLLQNGGFFKSHGRPGLSRVIIHKAVPTKGLTEEDLIPLRQQIRTTIVHALSKK